MYTKTCVICGKSFETKYKNSNMCPDTHFRCCVICGDKFIIDRNNRNVQTCSKKECRDEQRKRTCRLKYGGDAPMCSDEVKAKGVETSLSRYGTTSPNQSPEVKSSQKASMKARYGVEHTWQSEELMKKFEHTMEERYGVKRPTLLPDFEERVQSTNKLKYGCEWATQSDDIKNKIHDTVNSRYGVDCVFQNDKIKDKIKSTNNEKYGVDNPNQCPEIAMKASRTRQLHHAETISDPEKRRNYLQFIEDPVSYIESHFAYRPSAKEVSDSLGGYDIATLYLRLQPFDGSRLLSRVRSNLESEVEQYILSVDPQVIILKDDRSLISPKEVDLYLPEYSLAIECNPSYTHNSSLPSFNSSEIMSPSYHKMKSKMCEERGVFLFHLFGYEWANRQEVMKSIIANLLGKSKHRYYARKLEVREVPYEQCMQFLSQNHRQGATSSSIRLGLYDKDELISVMTFGKIRPNQGRKSEDQWELSRFCSKINTSVVGGASKLFKAFIDRYNPESVVSFSDIARSKGTLYQTLGFTEVSQSDPSYVWVTLDDTIYYNRVSCMKSNLVHLLKDDSIDLSKTERQIMVEHGYVQVYDCGVTRWEWHF